MMGMSERIEVPADAVVQSNLPSFGYWAYYDPDTWESVGREAVLRFCERRGADRDAVDFYFDRDGAGAAIVHVVWTVRDTPVS